MLPSKIEVNGVSLDRNEANNALEMYQRLFPTEAAEEVGGSTEMLWSSDLRDEVLDPDVESTDTSQGKAQQFSPGGSGSSGDSGPSLRSPKLSPGSPKSPLQSRSFRTRNADSDPEPAPVFAPAVPRPDFCLPEDDSDDELDIPGGQTGKGIPVKDVIQPGTGRMVSKTEAILLNKVERNPHEGAPDARGGYTRFRPRSAKKRGQDEGCKVANGGSEHKREAYMAYTPNLARAQGVLVPLQPEASRPGTPRLADSSPRSPIS
ncbi:hypothetical protein CYMTET_21048 [Cymbomonas tetramitiformis]|uniref:Uncharacterized protein n=1 Tax=Cymbomonas tetramitiformis TaxID=36881 RepID=A0AAE0L3L9_9CHLO|nr:hypothetical protein CYMTET_21048 [Cymbomonas tetramitiformis]